MMRSLYSGVSGLKVHQTKMDVIGNNISNVNTVGFKASTVTFADILYQTTQQANGPNDQRGRAGQNGMQVGLGAGMAAITAAISTSGGSQRTDNPFDLAIEGDGFFVVSVTSQDKAYCERALAVVLEEFPPKAYRNRKEILCCRP